MTISITYHPGFSHDAQDPVFYAGNFDSVATVSNGTQSFAVVVCGETRAWVWPTINKDEFSSVMVDRGDKWEDVDILTDADLYAAEDRIEWVYNSWYEVRANDANHEDAFDGDVFHTVDEAVAEITTWLEQQGTAHVHKNGVVELDPADIRATVCGACGRAWDDTVSTAVTPVPAGRCPFEAEHSVSWVEVIVTRTTTYRVSGTNPDVAEEWVFDGKAEVIDDNVLSVEHRLHEDER